VQLAHEGGKIGGLDDAAERIVQLPVEPVELLVDFSGSPASGGIASA